MRLRNVLFTIGFSFLLFSCNSVTQAYKETFGIRDVAKENQGVQEDTEGDEEEYLANLQEESNNTPVVEINLLENPGKLDEIQQQLHTMFPEKTLEIYPPHIYFEDDRIRLQLLDPNIPGNIDWYYYRTKAGTWEREDPVKTRANDRNKPIPLNTIKFSTASLVYQQLIKKAIDIEGAEIPSIVNFTFNTSTWNWNGTIRGSRSDYSFRADINGKEIDFKRQ